MKVVAFNGSPRVKGNTYILLNTVLKTLEKEGIETELVHVGKRDIHGCTACQKCRELKTEDAFSMMISSIGPLKK